MAELKAGPNVMMNMRIGDTVLRDDGPVSPGIMVCLNSKYVYRRKDGGFVLAAMNPLTGERMDVPIDQEEMIALKGWLATIQLTT